MEHDNEIEPVDLQSDADESTALPKPRRDLGLPLVALAVAVVIAATSVLWSDLRIRDATRKLNAAVAVAQSTNREVGSRLDAQRACSQQLIVDTHALRANANSGQLLPAELLGIVDALSAEASTCEHIWSQ